MTITKANIVFEKTRKELERRAIDLTEADHRSLLTAISCHLTCVIACTESPNIKLKPRAIGCFDIITSKMIEYIADYQLTIIQTMRVYAKIINHCTTQLLMMFTDNYEETK